MTSETSQISRRRFAQVAGSLFACGFAAGCKAPSGLQSSDARLTARPSATTTTWNTRTRGLGLGGPRDGVLYLPPNAGEDQLPLIVLLHGAGGSGDRILRYLQPAADSLRLAILAPDSVGQTWDALRAAQSNMLDVITSQRRFVGFGPDVTFLDRALARVFQTVAVDPMRIAIGGFSDGATYALSLGLMNGNLFHRIVAFSPGFFIEGTPDGRPEIFISHGRSDEILPIDRCSRRIVPALETRGYTLTYREFDGGHEVPEAIAREAMTWAS